MKQYVVDFANDEMECCSEKRRLKIRHILVVYERGLVTSFEAVRMICDSYYDEM